MTTQSTSQFVCRHCGCAVGFWHHGWKHQRGWKTKLPSCGRALTAADVEARK